MKTSMALPLFLSAIPSLAIAAEATTNRAYVPETAWELVVAAGIIGYFIVAAGVFAMIVAIQHLCRLDPAQLLPQDWVCHFEDALAEGTPEDARRLCQGEDTPISRICQIGLERMPLGLETMRESIQCQFDLEQQTLRSRLGLVRLTAGLAPMLGLLGTVGGMIEAFGKIALATNVDPSVLAGGIMMALMTTMLGLLVAVPATVLAHVLRNRIEQLITRMNGQACELVAALQQCAGDSSSPH